VTFDPAALDRHITGNYGEDQFADSVAADDCPSCDAEGALRVESVQDNLWNIYCDACGDRFRKESLDDIETYFDPEA
jgi:excinuclease UvrABC ATPase subunit